MLALVAGEGELPGRIMRHLYDTERPYRLCEMEGHASDARGDRPVRKFRVETLGSFIEWLIEQGTTEICFAGRVARPPLDPAKIDPATMPLVPRMMQALQLGDDAALRIVLDFFKDAGITPVGAHDLLPTLLPKPGSHTKLAPNDRNKRDAERGVDIIGAMAQADVGQACIVSEGQALAIEAQPGTDFMMATLNLRTAPVPDGFVSSLLTTTTTEWAGRTVGKGGVLVKAAKPGQELKIDMPTIGRETFLRAAQVGLEGIVIEAGRVMVLDFEACVGIADKADMFFWVKE